MSFMVEERHECGSSNSGSMCSLQWFSLVDKVGNRERFGVAFGHVFESSELCSLMSLVC